MTLDHVLERTVLIAARPATVFGFFTDPARFAAWWGAGSHIDARPGGAVHIRYPNGVVASGEVVEVVADRRIVVTYGYEDAGKPIPPGGSRVTVTLEETARGTRLLLRHELATADARDAHVPGWRYQLAVFANVAAAEQHAETDVRVDVFFGAWAEPDAALRREALAEVVTDDVTFRDAFACTDGLDDLVAHTGAVQLHMPGIVIARAGSARQCQGTAVVEWEMRAEDGTARGRGTNVFTLAPDGRIAGVVGVRAA
ncbi:MAG: SRPBCC domain-containing protein [Vicinamibacteria bacterium]